MAPIRRCANVVWEGMTGWTNGRALPDLLLVVPGRQGGSLGRWLETAAVIADVKADTVMVPAEANRPFRLAQLTALVREWMHAYTVDSVLMSCDGALFSLCPRPEHATPKELSIPMRWHHSVTVGAAVVGGLATLVPATAGARNSTTTVNVVAGKPSEFRFTLSKKTFPHGSVIFKLTNVGMQPHDFKICASPKGGSSNACTGTGTKQITRGQAATLTYTFKTKGSYEFLCTVPGHAAAGMKGDLEVT